MNKEVRHFQLETKDFGIFDVVEYEEYKNQQQELERYKNIIDEIEAIVYADISNIDARISIQETLDRLKGE